MDFGLFLAFCVINFDLFVSTDQHKKVSKNYFFCSQELYLKIKRKILTGIAVDYLADLDKMNSATGVLTSYHKVTTLVSLIATHVFFARLVFRS